MPRDLFFALDHGASHSVASVGGRDERHRPVLLQEALRALAPERGGWFFDATVGAGGHAEAVLEASAEARLIGVDCDREALRVASARLARFGDRVQLVHADFRDIGRVVAAAGIGELAGVIADLGVSSLQLDAPERGFSFRFDAPLDMRMDPEGEAETAAELLARLPEAEIARLLWEYGEERRARLIARAIVQRRQRGEPVETTRDLAELVAALVRGRRGRTHPATRVFQALRIAVNRELEDLDRFIVAATDLLQPAGRLVVISFHSLEDRIVKQTFRQLAAAGRVELLTKRPIVPTPEETRANQRARSAKLRALRRADRQ